VKVSNFWQPTVTWANNCRPQWVKCCPQVLPFTFLQFECSIFYWFTINILMYIKVKWFKAKESSKWVEMYVIIILLL